MNYFRQSILSGLNEYYVILKRSLDSLSEEEILWKPNPHSNNIIFLIWHMALVEDNLINKVLLGKERVWITENYYKDFPELRNETGFAFNQEKLDQFPIVDIDWLMNYHNILREGTIKFITNIEDEDLSLDYTFGTRQVKGYFVIGRLMTELSQHLGQVSYIRGMIRGLDK
ncbi:MAG: hypothetical protein CL740_05825 [Chloroflexi bacterium]|nr:hypothetical protein [Chloroflexota bacterium]